jgi:hypothetical protein
MSLASLFAITLLSFEPAQYFKDWTAGCDNGRRCEAAAFAPEQEDGVTLMLSRGPAPGDLPSIMLVSPPRATIADVVVDGRRLNLRLDSKTPEFPKVTAADSLRLARALAGARRARVVDREGRDLGPLLVSGAAAAMLLVDERQGRVGTRGALVRPGHGPNSRVPEPPPLPLVVSARPSPRAPTRLPELPAALLRKHRCKPGDTPAAKLAEWHRLDARHSLLTMPIFCKSGAYNIVSEVLIIPDGGRPRAATFDKLPMSQEGSNDALVYNVGWFGDERRLATGFRGRGIGDCGISMSYAWDGSRFRLVEAAELDECRSVTDFIVTFRARVTER